MRRVVSWIMLALFLVGTFTLAFRIQPARADGMFTGNTYASTGLKKDSVCSLLSSVSLGQQSGLITGNAVANVVSFEAIRWQEKTFYAAGRYWLFYIDGDYPTESSPGSSTVYYTSSTDGVSWASPISLSSGNPENSGENVKAFLSDSGYCKLSTGVIMNFTIAWGLLSQMVQ